MRRSLSAKPTGIFRLIALILNRIRHDVWQHTHKAPPARLALLPSRLNPTPPLSCRYFPPSGNTHLPPFTTRLCPTIALANAVSAASSPITPSSRDHVPFSTASLLKT